ncbi:Ferrous iron transport protein B [Candidatus Hydrogenisulfobacillus filiaventi]|uniref:Ferrous iron transport protein B n=1 Tax=Candidatus Hydrogenisulfobacillus filiaventi TaxID=2707344 RepID=A0A6F8ZFH8_9FIRM|nr:Ferrous iron transport protein B [Candidatus Hydrogenisulfobacillus filiaventi]
MVVQRVVLVGNPNVGKSRVFQRLTGVYAEVSNFPGTTVEVTRAALRGRREVEVADSPGVYGLSRFTPEEEVTAGLVAEADLLVNVVDATRLSRDLFLTLQLRELGRPLVVVLNLMDEVARAGARLDRARLSARLGVPVVPVSARTGEGFDLLEDVLRSWADTPARLPPPGTPPRAPGGLSGLEALLWAEEDPQAVARAGSAPPPGSREARYRARRLEADRLAAEVWTGPGEGDRWTRRLDAVLLHPLGGALTVVLLLLTVYELVGVLVAGRLVGALEGWVRGSLVPLLQAAVGQVFPPGSPPYRLLAGEFGILTGGVTYLFALLLPLVTAFYLLLAVLEDSGYLPRLATLLDRWFLKLGLNGRAVIPLVLGFGCVTMATVTTRILSTPRERTMATILLAWTVPCSAQMGVITGLLSGLGWRYAVAYAGIIVGLFVLVGTALDRTLPGRPAPLLLALPPLRWPQAGAVWVKTWIKVAGFLREAGPLFLIGSGAVELATLTGLLPALERALGPALQGWLGLPPQAASAFLLGFLRRDFGAAGFYGLSLSPHQVVTGAVTLTLFVPCLASTLVILKEQGLVRGGAIWLGSIVLALLTGGAVAHGLPL